MPTEASLEARMVPCWAPQDAADSSLRLHDAPVQSSALWVTRGYRGYDVEIAQVLNQVTFAFIQKTQVIDLLMCYIGIFLYLEQV